LVTRSFGDEIAKDSRNIVIPDHGKVTYLKLENEKNKLKYVIMASDGVWDALTIDEVIDCIPSKSGKSSYKVSPKTIK
jgi:serine/threonine protein phosphatase PrpC